MPIFSTNLTVQQQIHTFRKEAITMATVEALKDKKDIELLKTVFGTMKTKRSGT